MADPTLKELTETFVLTYDHQHALDEIERLQEESERFRTLLVEERRLHQLTHNAHMEKLIEAESMRNAIEAMRVAGGAAEFQAAFDKAKKLAMVHNAELSGGDSRPAGTPGWKAKHN